jgi:parvulin-like peptidyl-prolyl isomerase
MKWLLLCCWLAVDAPAVKVNGVTPPPEAWRFLQLTRGVTDLSATDVEQNLIDQLIDRELIRAFLLSRKTVADPDLVELRSVELEELIRRRGKEPAELLRELGLSPQHLQQELSLAAAWEQYIEQTVTVDELQARFQQDRTVFDGTRVRVRHLFRKAGSPEARIAEEQRLKILRDEIVAGKRTFIDAVKTESQSPSREKEGDIGWIVGLGQLPDSVARGALNLKTNDISPPIPSPLGVHLLQAIEHEPGQLSLEDARPQLLSLIAQERWTTTVRELRKTAKIVRPQ